MLHLAQNTISCTCPNLLRCCGPICTFSIIVDHPMMHNCILLFSFPIFDETNLFFAEEPGPQLNNYGRLVLPEFIPHSGVVSMDNPEYILQEAKRTGLSNDHTLGIPVVPSPTSSSGPSSLPAPPYTSLSSTGSTNFTSSPAAPHHPQQQQQQQQQRTAGLNGALSGQPASHRLHPHLSLSSIRLDQPNLFYLNKVS